MNRQERYRDRKRAAGFKYVSVPLTSSASLALARLQKRFGSQTAAVNFAILAADAGQPEHDRCIIVNPVE